MSFKKSLFIFRRDLRLEDNTGLIYALKNSEKVIPCFIFTPEQIEHNPYRSDHCLKFMVESIEDLEDQLKQKEGKLFLLHGKSDQVVQQCIDELNIDAVIVNRDYTPYSIGRDTKIEKVCKKAGIPFLSFDDALLHAPEETVKKDGKPYTIFTPYYRNALKLEVPEPVHNRMKNYYHGPIPFAKGKLPKVDVDNLLVGGRSAALKILKHLDQIKDYDHLRDFPAKDYTSHLSAYLKFTVVSPREVYAKLNPHDPLIRSLHWRDFFTSIALFFPHVFEGAFHRKFDKLKWSYDKKLFKKWCEGLTGFPIVDAGMREMNATGMMHNRVRMIVASFLVKDLHIDWRWGEQYFAQTLIDYDPAVNNGNWQWVASTGCDAQPYFRIFNPWSQQKKFDPDCVYIKKWIPELAQVPPKIIHDWANEQLEINYPRPMVEHEIESKKALQNYKKAAY
ncbi:MAG: deoxyribodipyrimidine photo-lyase [Verrucomicrobia bacterium]|nr:deoxyribodipyrimidine photo-lyase [Verrucomicrobiota bacterium]